MKCTLLTIVFIVGLVYAYDDPNLAEWRQLGQGGNSFVSNVLGNNMVLQRSPYKSRIWGWTLAPHILVTATLNNKKYHTTSGPDSFWRIHFDPMEAGGPYTINIASADGESAELENILFGDVWICSGQSNMQFTVSMAFNASEAIAEAQNYPDIRLFTVGIANTSSTPMNELITIEQNWTVADSDSVGGQNWTYFSAVCWFFGKDLYDRYGVPIGLISSNYWGTPIQSWSSPDALAQCNQTFEEDPFQDPNPYDPSVLWNAMIFPFLPMKMSGATWYQGEGNVGYANYYACQFPAMIKDWRQKFGENPQDFGFFFVQLAAYTMFNSGTLLAEMRLAQASTLNLPFTGMATAIDLGDVGLPRDFDIHPRNKEAVGYRLSLAARGIYYNDNVVYEGPKFKTFHVVQGPPTVLVNIEFSHESLGGGLVLKPSACPIANVTDCAWAEIQTSDGIWHNATKQEIVQNYFQLSGLVNGGVSVVGVRYGYNEWPVATLYNQKSLPATPFYLSHYKK